MPWNSDFSIAVHEESQFAFFLEMLVKSDHTRPEYFEYFVIHAVSNCAWKLFGTVQAKMIPGNIIAI